MYKNPFKSMEPSTTVYKNPLKSKKPPATVANPFRSMEPSTTVAASTDNPYAFLSTFDKIFLIDDSGSMAGRSWRETSKAIASTAPICTAYDEDRIDIYFSNDSSSGEEYKRSQSLKTRQEHSISTGEKKETRKWSKCSTCRQKKIDCMHQTRDWERKEHDWDYRLGWYQKLLDVETGAAQNAVSAGFAGAKGQTINKIKRGLSGFVNGSRTSAFPDTGAAENVVSVDFAREQQLDIKNNPGRFMLGNSKVTQSIGTVSMRWAFAEEPTKPIDIICHVLPTCTYNLILGSKFLAATETLVKYRRRVTQCAFNVLNLFHINLLDKAHQALQVKGRLGDHPTCAVADTGAERNVMDLYYAEALGLKINREPQRQGMLQFADGSIQETVGQVDTTWTFASDLKIPITFEVLENCSADVILGEDVVWEHGEHDVFPTHAALVQEMPYENEEDVLFSLAPFRYKNKMERIVSDFKPRIGSNKRTHRDHPREDETLQQYLEQYEAGERRRRGQWNHEYGFEGVNANPAEKEAEARRRRSYDAKIEAFRRRPCHPGETPPLISSIPTAPNNAPVRPTATSTEPRRSPSVTLSMPNAPTSTPVHPIATSTEPRGATCSTPTVPHNAPIYLTATSPERRRTRPAIPGIPTAPVHLNNSHQGRGPRDFS